MPIHRTLKLRSVTNDEFDVIDEAVMRCSYASQNHFGRLFDERIYENDMASRLRTEGFEVQTQVPVHVAHGSFLKTYYLDLVVNQMVYELKAIPCWITENDAQVLHYAMLQNVRLVKLINLGAPEVKGRLLQNTLTDEKRSHPTMRRAGWKPFGDNCGRLIEQLKALISDWGTHLDCRLYNEALVHFLGGEDHCLKRVEVVHGKLKLGTHLVQMHSPQHAFVVTGFSRPQPGYKKHLHALLGHASELRGIQWINLNHARLEVTSIQI